MYSEITLKEFEWYLRDLFFRNSKDTKNLEVDYLEKEKIAENLKNYLRYRDLDILEIHNLLDIVLERMVKDNIIKIDEKKVKIRLKIDRKQCTKCFYINYLWESEIIKCKRCDSSDLREFPPKKKST